MVPQDDIQDLINLKLKTFLTTLQETKHPESNKYSPAPILLMIIFVTESRL